jgi:DNA-binding IclR family transcriptional regulator
MNSLQLVTKRLYFGVDAMRLREATGRVLSRMVGQPPERATIGIDTLAQDFRLSAPASRSLADQMVLSGLLERRAPNGFEYVVTEKFREYAQARIVEPLPRDRAQLLLTHIVELAAHFNRTAVRNKYEIEIIAVFGDYMSRDAELASLRLGVTGRRRAPGKRHAAGRATEPTSGHEQIRALFEDLSSFVQVRFFQQLQEIPRPFSVCFKDES